MISSSEFWDVLAPHHGAIENNYLDLKSIRAIVNAVEEPVLVVGAGQGLIVAELRARKFHCDGVDLSPEMIKYAKLRRGITLVEANARAMPFEKSTYGTVIYATGVIDFMADEQEIQAILEEGRRVVKPSGSLFVAFYRVSRVLEHFMAKVGLLQNNKVAHRRSLEMYLLNPLQMVAWVANQARISYFRAALLLLGVSARTTIQEKATTFRVQKIFRNPDVAKALINAAPEEQAYRNEMEIRKLLKRLAIPVKQVKILQSCWIVQI